MIWLPRWVLVVKNLRADAGDMRPGFDPWVGKIPWRRKWQPTPVFLPGKSHGQRNMVGYSSWDHKELDKPKATSHTHARARTHTHTHTHK